MHRRVKALERADGEANERLQGPEWLEVGFRRAEEALERLTELVPRGEALSNVVAILQEGCGLLAGAARQGCTPQAFVVQHSLRKPQALVDLVTVTPPDLRPAVMKALGGRAHPLRNWLHHLSTQQSRLPVGLSADVTRRLLRIYLDEPDLIDVFSCTCDVCGLERPRRRHPPLSEWKLAPGCSPDERPLRYDLPEFFTCCPGCGDAAWTSTHLADWEGRAGGELVGTGGHSVEMRNPDTGGGNRRDP